MVLPLLAIGGIWLVLFFPTLFYGLLVDDDGAHLAARRQGRCPSVMFWHLETMFWHLSVCLLMYLILGRSPVSFLAALLFLINPINQQVSIWMSGRHYSRTAALTLLMWGTLPWGIVFLFPMILTGPGNAITAPMLLLLTPFWWLLLAGPMVILFLRRWLWQPVWRRLKYQFHGKKNNLPDCELTRLHYKKLIIMVKSYGYYTLHALIPWRSGFYHSFLYTFSMSETGNRFWYRLNWHFWRGLGLLGASLWLIVRYPGQPVSFGLIWWGIFILPWLNLITIQQDVTDRYCYLANVGLMLAAADLLVKLGGGLGL